MKHRYLLDSDIYSSAHIQTAIADYGEITDISLAWQEISFEADSGEEADEIFAEFMNYVVSLETTRSENQGLDINRVQYSDTEWLAYFRFKKFDTDLYLITNDIGRYQFLTEEEFGLLLEGKVEQTASYPFLLENGFLKTQDFVEVSEAHMREKMSFLSIGPSLHMMVISLRCNHKCKYCHAAVAPEDAMEYDMSLETAKNCVDVIMASSSVDLMIEFQGGEPLLNWQVLQDIVVYARKEAKKKSKKIGFAVVTNLTLMTEDKLAWLIENGVNICTSLDGTELTHNQNRTGYKGNSFEKVRYWIKRINEEYARLKKGKMWALLTSTKETLPYYKEIIDSYIELGLDLIFLRWLNPYGFASGQMEQLGYSQEERLDFYEKSLDYIIEQNKKWWAFREYMTEMYLKKIFDPSDPWFMDVRSPTWLISGGLAYNYDGKIYASDESRMLGRLGDESFLLWEFEESGDKTYERIMSSAISTNIIQSSILEGLPGYSDHVYKPYIWVDIINNHKLTGSVYQPFKKDTKTQIQIAMLDIIFQRLRNPEVRKIFLSWVDNN